MWEPSTTNERGIFIEVLFFKRYIIREISLNQPQENEIDTINILNEGPPIEMQLNKNGNLTIISTETQTKYLNFLINKLEKRFVGIYEIKCFAYVPKVKMIQCQKLARIISENLAPDKDSRLNEYQPKSTEHCTVSKLLDRENLMKVRVWIRNRRSRSLCNDLDVYKQNDDKCGLNKYIKCKLQFNNESYEFSGRPKTELLSMISHGGKGIALADFNERLIYKKKLFMKYVKHTTIAELNVERSVLDILEDYSNEILLNSQRIELRQFFSNVTFDIIVSMIIGQRVPLKDEKLKELRNYFDIIVKYLYDTELQIYNVLPWMKMIYQSKKFKEFKKAINKRDEILLDLLKEYDVNKDSTDKNGFHNALVRDSGEILDKDEIFVIILDTIAGGFETSTVVLQMFFALIIKYPGVKEKVLEEIKTVIGFSKSPTYSDKARMPFTSATILEVLRWISHIPLLLPHKAVVDTNLMGYRIPRDTSIFVNVAAVHKNEKFWGDPQNFRPERFLKEDGSLLEHQEGCRK
ncbi:DgyrCDS809 [Dimorphilus gyrociliatus]|uniref:DgyrCDS809 n=1 Tax=Dimorphilus gyrociliatus TaxID=2664684 RepID=A0A7I8V5F2_9ANNE|nr:DgyrCDS809 [Dimorphilus gyrociliatus]